jgi:drug/metabolite transporter (DMT)-like permease
MNASVSSVAKARRAPFSRTFLNQIINLVLFLGGSLLFATGWIMDERLPRGRDGRGLTLLGWDRHGWGALHAWVGYGLVALVALHLVLHAEWLKRVAARGRPWRLAAGLGVGAAMIAILAWLPVVRN